MFIKIGYSLNAKEIKRPKHVTVSRFWDSYHKKTIKLHIIYNHSYSTRAQDTKLHTIMVSN